MNVCGGSDTKTKTYNVPLDTLSYTLIPVKVGTVNGRGNGQAVVPISVPQPYYNVPFSSVTFDLLYDASCAQFLSLSTDGTLLDGIPVTVTPIPGGVRVDTDTGITLNGAGTLFNATFQLGDPVGSSIVCCPVSLQNWGFTKACTRATLEAGQICITPRAPELRCGMDAPRTITWNRSMRAYDPNPFAVTMRVDNMGDRAAANARFKITVPSADLVLIAPAASEQPGSPREVPVLGVSEATWQLEALPRQSGDSVEVCITASFDNHPQVTCCTKIWIPAAEAGLSCTVTAPTITPDPPNQRYDPMPFALGVTARNVGGVPTDSVRVRIVLPPGDLVLAGADAPDRRIKTLAPGILGAGQSGTATFTLAHPIALVEKRYTVGIWSRPSAVDSTYCETTVIIPALDAPLLAATCAAPDSVRFDPAANTYLPDPVRVRLDVVNTGTQAARNGWYTITVAPQDFQLVSPTTTTQRGYPVDVPAKGSASVSWDLRALYRSTSDSVTICITGTYDNAPEVRCCRKIWIPRVATTLACMMTAPAITANEQTQTYAPMPFTISVQVRNDGNKTSDSVLVQLLLPGDLQWAPPDLSAGGGKYVTPARIAPGGTATVTFSVTHPATPTQRDYSVYGTVINGRTFAGTCSVPVRIPRLLVPISVTIRASGPLQFCEGGSVRLDAGAGFRSYRWSTGDTTQTILATRSGAYTVTVVDAEGRSATSPSVSVTVTPTPRPRLGTGQPQTLCDGDTLLLDAGAGYAGYAWNTGATTRLLAVTTAGSWWVRVTTPEGCIGGSDTAQTTIVPRPPVPTIQQAGGLLVTQPGMSHQWYRNDTAIAGATDQFHLPLVSGSYRVGIRNQYGCESRSEAIDITVVSADGPGAPVDWKLAVYPSPVGDVVYLSVAQAPPGPLSVRIIDATGRRVSGDLELRADAAHPLAVDMTGQPAGTYFIVAAHRQGTQVVTFVKL